MAWRPSVPVSFAFGGRKDAMGAKELVLCGILLLCFGCGTCKVGQITFYSEPQGAAIYVDNEYKGEAPVAVDLLIDNSLIADDAVISPQYVVAKLAGYQQQSKLFRNESDVFGRTIATPFTKGARPKYVFKLPPAVSQSSALPQGAGVGIQRDRVDSTPPNPSPPTANMHRLGNRWAVIIGIADYRDTRIPTLRYASADAQAFYDWAVSPNGGKYSPARTKLLLDGEATGAHIKDALFNWLGQALEEDVVTIYFAGHGSPQSPDHPDNLFLLPHDCRYDNIPTTGLPMWDIETALKRYIKSKKVVVIADACHSGGVGQSFDIADGQIVA